MTCTVLAVLLLPLALAGQSEATSAGCTAQSTATDTPKCTNDHFASISENHVSESPPSPNHHSAARCSFTTSMCQYTELCSEGEWSLNSTEYVEMRVTRNQPFEQYSVLASPLLRVPHPSCLTFITSVFNPVYLEVLLGSSNSQVCTVKTSWTGDKEGTLHTDKVNIPEGVMRIMFRGQTRENAGGYARVYRAYVTKGCCPESTNWSEFVSNKGTRSSITDREWEHGGQWEFPNGNTQEVKTRGDHATLTTPLLQHPPANTWGCVTFSYHIPNNAPGSLEASIVSKSRGHEHVRPVWKVAYTQTVDDVARNGLSLGQLPVILSSEDGERNFRVRFTADRQGELPIALDQVRYEAEPPIPCAFAPSHAHTVGGGDQTDDNNDDDDVRTNSVTTTSPSPLTAMTRSGDQTDDNNDDDDVRTNSVTTTSPSPLTAMTRSVDKTDGTNDNGDGEEDVRTNSVTTRSPLTATTRTKPSILPGITLALIIISIVVAVAAVGGGVGFLIWKRKKGRRNKQNNSSVHLRARLSESANNSEPGGPPASIASNYSDGHDILQPGHGTTPNYEEVNDVTNDVTLPTAGGAGPGVTSPQGDDDDDDTYNRLNLAGRNRGAPSGDPPRHRGPREEEDYNRLGDVIPGGPPQAANSAKKEGDSASNVYFELEADVQLSTQTTVAQSVAEDPYDRLGAVKGSNPPPKSGGATPHQTTIAQSAAEDPYDRLGAVRGSNPPPKSGGATPHGAYDRVVLAKEEGAYDVAQIGQRKKKDVIDSDYHQISDFSKGE